MANARDVVFGLRFGIQDKRLKQANRQVNLLKNNVNQSSGAFSRLGRSAITAGKDIVHGIKNGINTLHNFRYELLGAFTAMSAAVGGAIKTAADFEYQIRTTGLVARATAHEIDMLSENAKQLGIETVFTATEAAEGQEILARAGFETREIIKTLPSVLDAAAIENLELARSADIVTSILRGMQMEVGESRRIIDTMANASRRSKATMDELGESIPQVAAQAANLGFSIEELSAVFGLLSDQGTKASRAGRLMRGVIKSLTAPSNQAIKALDRLQVDLWENEDQFKSITGIVEEFSTAMEGMSEKSRQKALGEIFTGRRLLIFQQLLNAGSDEIANFTSILEESGGVAEYMAEQQLDTFMGALHRLRGSVNVAAISMQLQLLPTLSNVVDGITRAVNAFNDMPEMTQTILGGLGIVATTLLGIATVAAFLKTPFSMLAGFFKWLGGTAVFQTLLGGMNLTVGTALALIGVVVGLYLAFEDLYLTIEHGYDGVLLPVIDKFLDFIGVGYDFIDVWERGKEGLENFLDSVVQVTDGLWTMVSVLGNIIKFDFSLSTWTEFADGFWDITEGVLTAAGILAAGLLNAVLFIAEWTINPLIDMINNMLGIDLIPNFEFDKVSFTEWWEGVKDWIGENLTISDYMKERFDLSAIVPEFPNIEEPFDIFWEATKLAINSFNPFKGLQDVFDLTGIEIEFPDIEGNFSTWWNGFKGWMTGEINPLDILKDKFDFQLSDLVPGWLEPFIPGLGEGAGDNVSSQPNNQSDTGNDTPSSPTESILGGAAPINRTNNQNNNSKIENRNDIQITIDNTGGNNEDLERRLRRAMADVFNEIQVSETGGF